MRYRCDVDENEEKEIKRHVRHPRVARDALSVGQHPPLMPKVSQKKEGGRAFWMKVECVCHGDENMAQHELGM